MRDKSMRQKSLLLGSWWVALLLVVWAPGSLRGQERKTSTDPKLERLLKEELKFQETEKLKTVERALQSYTPIYVNGERKMKFGSGVFVGDHLLLTANHLALPEGRYFIDDQFEHEFV